MRRLTYQIKLCEPALITGLEGDPNSSVTLPFLLGSALRGVFIAAYLRDKSDPELDLQNELERRLFFDGSTRYLNGYIAQPFEGALLRSLPTPRSWYRPKYTDKLTIYDFAVNKPSDLKQPKSIKSPFVTTVDSSPHFVEIERTIRIQTSRDRDFGRATTDNGAVYRYESLQKGQTFIAHILCDNDDDAEVLLPFLDSAVHIGGVRSSDYGRAELTLLEDMDEDETWSECDKVYFADDPLVGNTAVVTLLSDALLLDAKTGQYTVAPEAIGNTLGLNDYANLSVYVAHRPIGGFNRKWGLPLPQTMAFQMGSVFVFSGLSNESIERLHTQRAIGEQQVEGFGRIAINWHTSKEVEPIANPDEIRDYLPDHRPIADSAAQTLAQRMTQRRFRQILDRKLLEKVDDVTRGQRVAVSKSQLYRLRFSVQAALQTILQDPAQLSKEREALKNVVQDIRSRGKVAQKFARVRLKGQPMLQWLQETIEETGFVFAVNADDYPRLGSDVRASADDALKFEYTLRYLDAVLGRLAKEK